MPTLNEQDFARRAAGIAWILCDVDGVLTDGGLYYDHKGATLLRFDVRDGLGIALAQQVGLKFGLISGRSSQALDSRASELGIDEVLAGSADKAADFDGLLQRHSIDAGNVAFIGDDLTDLIVMQRSGLCFAPADAAAEVRKIAHHVTERPGGHGAVREAIEILLKARGDWDRLLPTLPSNGP